MVQTASKQIAKHHTHSKIYRTYDASGHACPIAEKIHCTSHTAVPCRQGHELTCKRVAAGRQVDGKLQRSAPLPKVCRSVLCLVALWQ